MFIIFSWGLGQHLPSTDLAKNLSGLVFITNRTPHKSWNQNSQRFNYRGTKIQFNKNFAFSTNVLCVSMN